MKSKYFFCYNPQLGKFLQSKNFKYITKAQHPSSQQIFTLFENSDDLSNAIEEYKTVFKH